jgi:hypothetical protein
MSTQHKRSGSVVIRSIDGSPYELPEARLIEAQDPPTEDVPAEETDAGPTEEELVKEVEDSPGAQWEKYLQPILRVIKDTKLKVPIELHNNYSVGVDGDVSLGFRITGVVYFIKGVPPDIAYALQGSPLRYVAFITPDGRIGDVSLVYDDAGEEPQEPVYRVNRNVTSTV